MFCSKRASEIFRQHCAAPWAEFCHVTDWLRWPVRASEFAWRVKLEAAWEYEWAVYEMRARAMAIWRVAP